MREVLTTRGSVLQQCVHSIKAPIKVHYTVFELSNRAAGVSGEAEELHGG